MGRHVRPKAQLGITLRCLAVQVIDIVVDGLADGIRAEGSFASHAGDLLGLVLRLPEGEGADAVSVVTIVGSADHVVSYFLSPTYLRITQRRFVLFLR